MYENFNLRQYEANRTQLLREARHERLVSLARRPERPAAKRSLLARLAQYVSIFLVL